MTREVGFFFSAFLPFNGPQLPVPEVPTRDPHCNFAVSSKKTTSTLSWVSFPSCQVPAQSFGKSVAGQGLAKAVPADRRVEAAAFARSPFLSTCTPALRTPTDPPALCFLPSSLSLAPALRAPPAFGVFLGRLHVNGCEWYI